MNQIERIKAAAIHPENWKARPIKRAYPLASFRAAYPCLLYTSPSPRDRTRSRMPSSA